MTLVKSHLLIKVHLLVLLPAGRALRACPAGNKIALRSRIGVFVCVCSSAIITCAKLRHFVTKSIYSHERIGNYWKSAG